METDLDMIFDESGKFKVKLSSKLHPILRPSNFFDAETKAMRDVLYKWQNVAKDDYQ